MVFRIVLVILLALLAGAASPSYAATQEAGATSAELQQNIATLAALDFPERMHAARLIRRTAGAVAVPALVETVRHDSNEFVRYRALVLLTSFNDPGTGAVVRDLLRDKNDRVRQVAFEWLERHPDSRSTAILVGLLQTEPADFVRPALVGALAALGDEGAVQRPLVNEVSRGLDFFRSAVIEALGRHRATYALDAIVNVARLAGPLQDDAVLAVGRIGGPDAAAILSELTDLKPEADVMRRGARCLIGENCLQHLEALATIAASTDAGAGEVRAAIEALSAIAQNRNEEALAILVRIATGTTAMSDRASVAVASVALRQPDWTVAWINNTDPAKRDAVIDVLKDGFDSLEEDFAEEQFFAAVRAGYWRATEGSPERALAAAVIQRLEF